MTKDMTHDIQTTQHDGPQQGEIILYQPDETVRLEVRLEDDTVWLTQAQMAELFGRERSVIAKHIGNCFREGELTAEEVCAKFAQTTVHGAIAGKVQVHEVTFYNLDVIISVGYRVKSVNGTKFRQWATRILLQRLQQLHDQEHSNRPVDIAAFTHPFHDRFLIIDDDLWHCGASFKDLGRRLFAIDRLNIDKSIILGQL